MEKTSSVLLSVLMLAVVSVFFLCFPAESPAPCLCPDDGKLCTDDYCVGGVCQHPPVVCDESSDECYNNTCDNADGVCKPEWNGSCDVDECDPADPKTQGYWKRQCKALEGIPRWLKLHEEWMRGYDWGDDPDPCIALLAKGDMCVKADIQITAVMLNYMSERVADCNCLMGGGTVGEAWSQLNDSVLTCKEKNDLAEGINSGDWLAECTVD